MVKKLFALSACLFITMANVNASGGYADGLWVTPCTNDADDEYAITAIEFDGGSVKSTIDIFTDAACTTPASPSQFGFVGTVVYPSGKTATSLGEAQHMDITVKQVPFDGAPAPEAMLELFKAEGVFDTSYGLVLVTGTTLYLGSEDPTPGGAKPTPETRATELDTNDVFERQ